MKSFTNAFVSLSLASFLCVSVSFGRGPQDPQNGIESTKVWTSVTTGKDYKLSADSDHLHIEGVLPAALSKQGAFFRCDLTRRESEWLGTCISYLPYPLANDSAGRQANWCRIETQEKISLLTGTRIEGEFETLDAKSFDPATCDVKKGPMKHFAWIPKK